MSRFGNQSYGGGRRPQQNRIRYMRVDPRVLVKKAEFVGMAEYVAKTKFEDLPVEEIIKRNIKSKGYTSPTPIQDQIMPHIFEGKDVIGLAATGTGKTAAFLIPLIQKIQVGSREKVLIVVPTRELAVQIIEEGRGFARGTRAYFALVIGGVAINGQIRDLKRNPSIVVGTPGRIKDLIERRFLRPDEYKTIVLDEVDRMLDMGFIHDIRSLIMRLPRVRQSLFFSATMSDAAKAVAREFLHEPVTVEIAASRASENVDQDIVRLNGRNKIDVLHDLLIRPGFEKVLVFGRTKHGIEKLTLNLVKRGFAAAAIHGNKSQNQRQRALNAFKDNQVKILLATDVASRGIDIDNVSHVINFELPETYDDYIHRIGRTGRADRTGIALTFID